MFTGVNDTGDKFFAGVIDTAEQLITGVLDTSDEHKFANISENFRKKFKKAPMEYLGAWGTLIHEKNLKSKILCQTPFKYKPEPLLKLDHERGELREQDLGGRGTELGVSLQQVSHQLCRSQRLSFRFGPTEKTAILRNVTLDLKHCIYFSLYRFSAVLFMKFLAFHAAFAFEINRVI